MDINNGDGPVKEKTLKEIAEEQIAKDTGNIMEKKEETVDERVEDQDTSESAVSSSNSNEESSELTEVEKEAQLNESVDNNENVEPKKEKEIDMDEKIGNYGLTRRDLTLDPRTPAETMGNLSKFTEEYSKEVEAEKAKIDKLRAQEEADAALKKLQEEKKNASKFNDEIIEDDQEKEITDRPKIDVTAIKIKKVDDSAKAFNEILEKRKKKLRTTSVPLSNSGYIAHMMGLSSPEIRDISMSLRTRDQFAYWDYLYQTIYEKIQSTSMGNMSYETFLKSTALSELDILLYGMFCSTYPDKNDFPITCPNPACNSKFEFSYYNSQYLDIDPEDKSAATEAMRNLVAGQTNVDPTEFFRNSNTNSVFRVPLESSGMIVEVRHPTLWNQLHDVIKQLVDNQVEKASDVTLNRMPYVQKILVPVDEDNLDAGYYEFEDLMKKVSLLTNLDEEDDLALEEGISDNILDKYKINFKVKGIACPTCCKPIPDEAVDFRDLLFTIHQIRSVKKK